METMIEKAMHTLTKTERLIARKSSWFAVEISDCAFSRKCFLQYWPKNATSYSIDSFIATAQTHRSVQKWRAQLLFFCVNAKKSSKPRFWVKILLLLHVLTRLARLIYIHLKEEPLDPPFMKKVYNHQRLKWQTPYSTLNQVCLFPL